MPFSEIKQCKLSIASGIYVYSLYTWCWKPPEHWPGSLLRGQPDPADLISVYTWASIDGYLSTIYIYMFNIHSQIQFVLPCMDTLHVSCYKPILVGFSNQSLGYFVGRMRRCVTTIVIWLLTAYMQVVSCHTKIRASLNLYYCSSDWLLLLFRSVAVGMWS
jgi:hypothetical protein